MIFPLRLLPGDERKRTDYPQKSSKSHGFKDFLRLSGPIQNLSVSELRNFEAAVSHDEALHQVSNACIQALQEISVSPDHEFTIRTIYTQDIKRPALISMNATAGCMRVPATATVNEPTRSDPRNSEDILALVIGPSSHFHCQASRELTCPAGFPPPQPRSRCLSTHHHRERIHHAD